MTRARMAAGICILVIQMIGCGTQNVGDQSSRSSALQAAGGNGPVVQSATGHVDFIGRQGAENRYEFVALKRIDRATGEAVVDGELQYQTLRPDGGFIDAHASVICLEIEGNVARFATRVDHARGDIPPGTSPFGYFTVEDNGEGENDPPDRASNLFVTTDAGAHQHCDTGHVPPPPLFDNLQGNIQVRP